jgi:hypothetical protein
LTPAIDLPILGDITGWLGMMTANFFDSGE